MNMHRHLSSEEIFEQISLGEPGSGIAGCERCEAEASSLAQILLDLRRADPELVATTEWDDLLLRRRIREALGNEKPHVRSLFDRFAILRPALVFAVVASIVLLVWSPMSRYGDRPGTRMASVDSPRVPAWDPLPAEAEDEGLAVLAEWNPNEDELAIAGCLAACLSGLSNFEEENLRLTGGSPL